MQILLPEEVPNISLNLKPWPNVSNNVAEVFVIFNWLLLQTQKANYFLPNSEAFYETLFIRLPTLIRQYDIPKDWKDK
jgi:hypothetical protein